MRLIQIPQEMSSNSAPKRIRTRRTAATAAAVALLSITGLAFSASTAQAASAAAQVRICTTGDRSVDFVVGGTNQDGKGVTSPTLTLHAGQCNTFPNGPWWWAVDTGIRIFAHSSTHGGGSEIVNVPRSAAGGTFTVNKNFITIPG